MAELQTIAAVFDLLKLTWEAGRFMKRVSDADKTAQEVCDRVKRLEGVLRGIQAVLQSRDEDQVLLGSDNQIIERVRDSVLSLKRPLAELLSKAGRTTCSKGQDASKTPWDRVKIAWNSSSIKRINGELEARLHILSTDLLVLQLYEQTRTNINVESNHEDLLQALSQLSDQVTVGNSLIQEMVQRVEHNTPESLRAAEALSSLSECIHEAEDVHERLTEQHSSRHQPDDARSERLRRTVGHSDSSQLSNAAMPSLAIATPITSRRSFFGQDWSFRQDMHVSGPIHASPEDQQDIWPLEILNLHIDAYAERARLERESRHFSQAEVNLAQAIHNCKLREERYSVPFNERLEMQEDLAVLYQKQQKFAEAVALIHELLREQTPSIDSSEGEQQIDIARQNHLLASIYYDRHLAMDSSLNSTLDDVEKAQQYALKAFNVLWRRPERDGPRVSVLYSQCVHKLVEILEARGKHVEANEMRKLLEGAPAGELRRTSTAQSRPQTDAVLVDKHDILRDAIQSCDIEQVRSLLASKDVDLERCCKDGKTFLMHAIEQSNESIVSTLLDPEIGVYINGANAQGLTALHAAADAGLYEMVRCLLEHDADTSIKDHRGETAVVKAVKAGRVTTVEVFFDKDRQTLQTTGSDESSLLHYAVQSSRKEMVDVLLDLSPDLAHALDRSGKTALHHCAMSERLAMATALLEHRNQCDINAEDSISRTPLFLVASKPATPQRVQMVRLLLAKGASIDKKPPLRIRDYVDPKPLLRRDSTLSRTSVSTEGTVGTASTGITRLSRALGRFGSR